MNTKHFLAVAVMASSAAFTAPAFAHAKLLATQPKANSVVATAPQVVRLQFNEPVELAFSKVKLADGTALKLEVDKDDPKTVVATLPPLKLGPHRVQWTMLTRDGHKVKGEFAFHVR